MAPENITVRYNLGSLLTHRGDFVEAAEHLRVVAGKKPSDGGAQLALAQALLGAEEFGEAFEHFKKAAAAEPSLTPAWLEIAALLTGASQHGEAKAVLEDAHRRMPHNGPIAHALARLLAGSPILAERDGARALDLALKVFNARPGFEHARTVAMAYAEEGRCDDAVQWQNRAIDLATVSPRGATLLGMLKANLEHYRDRRPCRVPEKAPGP